MHKGEKAGVMSISFQYIYREGNKLPRLGPIVSHRGKILHGTKGLTCLDEVSLMLGVLQR